MELRRIEIPHPDGPRRIAVWDRAARRPDPALPPVFCVHGLTRNGRDFDRLAESLAETRRVLCPDVLGRGKSDLVDDPAHYNNLQYAVDLAEATRALGLATVDWVGTSMGGLIGMLRAAGVGGAPAPAIRRFVVNDVGPAIPVDALRRIGTYVGTAARFADIAAAEAHFRAVHAPFAPMSDDDWRAMAETSIWDRGPDGLTPAYDPRIGDAFDPPPEEDVVLWDVWDAVRVPVLILRGETSDLLSEETAARMAEGRDDAVLCRIAGAGHAPSLNGPAEIEAVARFLAVA